MFRSKSIALMTIAAALLGFAGATLAAEEGAPAASETTPVAGQPQPQSADTPASDPNTSGVSDPRRKTPPVAFTDVNYEDAGDASKLTLAGKGDAGAQIQLFFDDAPLGQVVIGEDGTWKFESDQKMDAGQHTFRADRFDEKGVVIGRASIIVARVEKK
jgi:hypothetical protein